MPRPSVASYLKQAVILKSFCLSAAASVIFLADKSQLLLLVPIFHKVLLMDFGFTFCLFEVL
jgi:hypothetical protein